MPCRGNTIRYNMNRSRALRIGNRINLVLLRQLGVGVDVKRLIDEPLYARDVYFVCGGLPGTDLVALARDFRRALDEPDEEPSSEPPWSFRATRPAVDSELPQEDVERRPQRQPLRVLPLRWLAR
jgi:hypothetical protein